MQLDKAKHLIDIHEVISFDIFDTLLLRPYLRPTDVFVHLEKKTIYLNSPKDA